MKNKLLIPFLIAGVLFSSTPHVFGANESTGNTQVDPSEQSATVGVTILAIGVAVLGGYLIAKWISTPNKPREKTITSIQMNILLEEVARGEGANLDILSIAYELSHYETSSVISKLYLSGKLKTGTQKELIASLTAMTDALLKRAKELHPGKVLKIEKLKNDPIKTKKLAGYFQSGGSSDVFLRAVLTELKT